MSSDGDIAVVNNSLNDNLTEDETYLFHDRNVAFITDTTNGAFTSGMATFDLSTLSSQNQWVSLSEIVIELPFKITASILTPNTTQGGVGTQVGNCGISTAVLKAGFHSIIDSCQIQVAGATIQQASPFENVCASFRILSNWSQDNLKKWGTATGFAIDDCTNDNNTSNTNNGLNGATFATQQNSVRGFDSTNHATIINKGLIARNAMINNDISTTSVQGAVLGTVGMKAAAVSNAAGLPSITSLQAATAGTVLYTQYVMATIRLKDIADLNDFPCVKNLKGMIYLSYNSTSVNLTATGVNNAVIATMSILQNAGRSCPFTINTGTNGLIIPTNSTTAVGPITVQITGSVDASGTNSIGNSGPLITTGRLLAPFYISNPKTDQLLSNSAKYFSTLEKIVNPIASVAAGATVNYTISAGLPNAKKLLLLPMWINCGGTSNLLNPEQSPFDSTPATSGVFATLSNLQVYVGNKPIYQYPIQYNYEQWLTEQSGLGLNGGVVDNDTSQLLTSQLFDQNHRFYYVNLSRQSESESGASKSIQVSFTNPAPSGTGLAMKVIAVVWYQKRWVINTNLCQISSV